MKCMEVQQQLTEILGADPSSLPDELGRHLQECTACRTRFEQEQRLLEAIRPPRRIVASQQFKERVMNAIVTEENSRNEQALKGSSWNLWPRWVILASVSAVIFAAIALLPAGWMPFSSPGMHLLNQSVKAMSHIQTVHMSGRMRTAPGDNFELIGANYAFVPLELWRTFGEPSRWRVEKTGRIVVMDGQASTLYMSTQHEAMKASPQAGFITWLKPLLNPEQILQAELDAARQGDSTLSESKAADTLTLTIHRKAKGNFADPWSLNKSIPESDHTLVYTFDAESKLLKSLRVSIQQNGTSTDVLEISDIRYDEPINPSIFSLDLPADVAWLQTPAGMKTATASFRDPRDVAEFFFTALAQKDWTTVLQVYPQSSVKDAVKQYYGGLQIVSIGQASRSGLYPGYFVPYKVRLPGGAMREFRLAVRNDNPAHRWYVDGGY